MTLNIFMMQEKSMWQMCVFTAAKQSNVHEVDNYCVVQ